VNNLPPVVYTRYCSSCGTALSGPPPTRCGRCGAVHYLNPKPCGEAILIEDRRVLLLRRASEPWQGAWDVPGGFCEGDEHPMHAAERELAEELGVTAEAVAYVGTWIDAYGPPAPDGVQLHTANSSYLMRRDVGGELRLQAEEVTEAGWFRLDELPRPLGFPGHMETMLRAAARLDGRPAGPLPDRTW
jgi:ADP-ribose pyrophosphatase YjhB (NUDIX family)